MLLDLDLANAIFLFCLVLGGGLLLVTVLLDEIVGGLLDAVGLGFDIGGVTLMLPLLGFVAMFGVGGLIGTQVLQLDNGRASLVGAVAGAAGFALVFGMFSVLRRSESAPAFSLGELVGQTGRVNVAIPARRFGSVFVSYAGASHNLTATADADVPSGAAVRIVSVAGSNIVVEPLSGAQGGIPNA
jgi:membrane protein implicated in regulation of membrane protease activity